MATIAIAGSSGFLGTHLANLLVSRGHGVVKLVRKESSSPDESTWDPYGGRLDESLFERADAVVNLAGSPTVGNPHSKKWARNLEESRVTTTRVLAEAIASSDRKPAFMAGNGISFYGDRPGEVLTEESDSQGDALLTHVARVWQEAAHPAVDAGARVCIIRTPPVMDAESDPLSKLKLLFKLGLGGKLGKGDQHMPMCSLRDWTGAVAHLIEHESASGPFNLTCPTTPTNAEFTEALAEQLSRPSFATVPAPIIRKAAGELAPDLLGSINALPEALQAVGFEHRDPEVRTLLRAGLSAVR